MGFLHSSPTRSQPNSLLFYVMSLGINMRHTKLVIRASSVTEEYSYNI